MSGIDLNKVLVRESVVPTDFTSGIYFTRIVDWSVREGKGWVEIHCEILKTAKSKQPVTTVPHLLFSEADIKHLRACMYYRQFEFKGTTTREFLDSLKGSCHRVHVNLEPADSRFPESKENPMVLRVDFNSKYKK